jgi:hypothetical protein
MNAVWLGASRIKRDAPEGGGNIDSSEGFDSIASCATVTPAGSVI